VKRIHIPLLLGIISLHDRLRQLVGAGDHRSTRLASVKERVAIDFASDRVMDDVTALKASVLFPQPGIEPETLDAYDLLLFLAHRPGDVHHVDDDRIRRWRGSLLPGAEALVFVLRRNEGARRIIGAGCD